MNDAVNDAGLALVFGWTGAVMGTAMAVVQAIRIRRNGTEGVSVLTWSLFLAVNWFWAAFGLGTGSVPLFIGSIASNIAIAYIVFAAPGTVIRRPLVIAHVLVVIAVFVPSALAGWNVGLITSELIAIGLRIPQVRDLYRTTTARGVSVSSWLISATNCALWAFYGAFDHRIVLLIANTALVAINLVIAALAWQRHHKLRRIELAASAG